MRNSFRQIALALTLVALNATNVLSYDFKVGDLAYNFVAGTSNQVIVTFTSNVLNSDPPNYYGVTNVNIPETVKYNGKTYTVMGIDAYTFQYAPIQSIKIPKTVKQIGAHAFYGCAQLSAVHISDLAAWCDIDYLYTSSDIYSSSCCPAYSAKNVIFYLNGQPLTDVVIPVSVTQIKPLTFYNWKSLKSITLNKNLKSIGTSAFTRCDNLERVNITDLNAWFGMEGHYNLLYSHQCNLYLNNKLITDVVVPEGITKIPNYVFYNNKSLKNITFHNRVDTLGMYAFSGCEALTTLVLPYSIQRLGLLSFYNCTGLQSIYVESYKPLTTNSSFENADYGNCTLYVPAHCVNRYKYAAGWQRFTNIVGWDPFPGDINEDYVANGTDVTALYNYLLKHESLAGDADVNGDGVINGTDVTSLYNILLR